MVTVRLGGKTLPLIVQHEVARVVVVRVRPLQVSTVDGTICNPTTIAMQIIVIANDGHTFLEPRSCPRWHALMMRMLPVPVLHSCIC